jgi:hypothetical protein
MRLPLAQETAQPAAPPPGGSPARACQTPASAPFTSAGKKTARPARPVPERVKVRDW